MDEKDARTLKQVIVVHRHGTRFPTKPPGSGNLSWPLRAQFWESYGGHLTPVGSKQLQDIGEVLRKRYIDEGGGIFKGAEQVDGRVLAVYTSNIQRTLQSAWSFLLGLVPRASIFFAFRSERVFSQALKQSVGVPIYVEDATEGDDRLFHEWKLRKGYKKWNKENRKRSKFFQQAKDDPEYVKLLDKLFDLTKETKLRPRGGDPLARLCAAKDVDTQVMIDEAHGRPALPNPYGEAIGDDDRRMLKNIGDELKRCWFADANGDVSQSYGRKGAGYLGHKIWRHMAERAEYLCHQRFVQFSCHDTTIAALAAHLGVELPDIGFGAFMLFELHRDSETREYSVRFYYNSFPTEGQISYNRMRSIALPLGTDRIVKLDDCASGAVSLSRFQEHCQLPAVEETFEMFTKLLGRADISPTRDALEDLLAQEQASWMTFSEWKDKHHNEFLLFDVNGDGHLCYTEMEAGLAYWYGIAGKTVDLVFNLLDRDPLTDALSEKDVYLAMYALVGVRGSISAKTTGGSVLPESETDSLEDVNMRSSAGTTKLMAAVSTGDATRVKDLITRGADVNAQDDYGWTALRYAARRKDMTIAQMLIDMGADINLASKSGRTPLMSAVANNGANVVQLMVEAGADVNARNREGLTAFDLASRGGGMGSSIIRTLVKPATVGAT